MINTTVDYNKVKTDILNKTKDELRKLASTFKIKNKSLNKPPGATIAPLHLNCSSDRAYNGADNQKTYEDVGIYLHGTLKKNQGAFLSRWLWRLSGSQCEK